MRVRIKKLGKKAYGGQNANGGLDLNTTAFGGADYSLARGKKGIEVKSTLTKDPRSQSNLEAEGGETAFGPVSGDGIPDHYKISGPRHSDGGVPLNLPDDTFIFSDTKRMRITDPVILKMFGKKPKKGGYTPAELAKPYDINKYKAILMDPDSDELTRNTAELMIKNMIIKLGALALAQEAKKGFPQGIPEMARPYMEQAGISDEDVLPNIQQQAPEMPIQEAEVIEDGMEAPPQAMPSGEPIARGMVTMPPQMQQPMPMQPPMNFGGFSDLDRFVYGGDSDDGLVKAEDGIVAYTDKGEPMTRAQLIAYRQKYPNAPITLYSGTEQSAIQEGYTPLNDGILGKGIQGAVGNRALTIPTNITRYTDDVCRDIKIGRDGVPFTRKEAIKVGLVKASRADEFEDCYRKETQGVDLIRLKEDDPDTEIEVCECVDPTNGETYTFPKPEGETKCPCVRLIEGARKDGTLESYAQKPVISDINREGIRRALLMNPNVPGAQFLAGDRIEVAPAFQEIYIQPFQAAAREATEASSPATLADAAAVSSNIQAAFMKQAGADAAAKRLENIRTQNRFNLAQGRFNSIYENAFANAFNKQQLFNQQRALNEIDRRNQKSAGVFLAKSKAQSDKERLAALNAMSDQFAYNYRDPAIMYFTNPKKITPVDELTMAERAQRAAQIMQAFPGEANAEARKRELDLIYGKQTSKNGGFVFGANVYPFLI
jgi:hypothetical protein